MQTTSPTNCPHCWREIPRPGPQPELDWATIPDTYWHMVNWALHGGPLDCVMPGIVQDVARWEPELLDIVEQIEARRLTLPRPITGRVALVRWQWWFGRELGTALNDETMALGSISMVVLADEMWDQALEDPCSFEDRCEHQVEHIIRELDAYRDDVVDAVLAGERPRDALARWAAENPLRRS